MKTDSSSKEILPLSKGALSILTNITEMLQTLLDINEKSCLSENFRRIYSRILALFSEYQDETLRFSNLTKCCFKGCAHCCCHWVEDVNSFEMEIIADYIRKKLPHEIKKIISTCKNDIREMDRLREIVEMSLSELTESERATVDPVDISLAVFYQSERKCQLALPDGTCAIYDIRPLTCRIYMNFIDPSLCVPKCIDNDNAPTYLLDLDEKANALLEQLHFRYLRFSDDTALRSLLVKYLE